MQPVLLLRGISYLTLFVLLSPLGLATFNPALAETSPLSCEAMQHQVNEQQIRDGLGQASQSLQSQRTQLAAQTLGHALQEIQALRQGELKSNFLREITEISTSIPPDGLLIQMVEQARSLNQPGLVLPVLAEARQAAQSLSSGYSFTKISALVAIARHYTTLGQPDAAIATLAQAEQAVNFLQGDDFKVKALTAIAEEYNRLGAAEPAIRLLNQASQLVAPLQTDNLLQRAWLLQPIAVNYARANAFEQARQIAEIVPFEVAEGFYRGDTLAQMAKVYLQTGQMDRAVQVAENIERNDIQATTLGEIALAYARVEQPQQAQALFAQAEALIRTEANPEFRAAAVPRLVLQYAQIGQPQKALDWIATLADPRAKIQAIADMAALDQEANQSEALLTRLIAIAQSIEPVSERNLALQQIAESYMAAGEYALALRVVQTLDEADPFSNRAELLTQIARRAAAAGEYEAALQATQAIPTQWVDYRNQSWQALALAYAKVGQYEQALQGVEQIDNYGSLPYQVRTLAAIAGQYLEEDQPTQALATLDQAQSITDAFETDLQTTDGLVAMAIQYARAGEADKAAALRSQAIQIAQQATDQSHQDYLFRGMVQQYIEAQQSDAALEVARAVRPGSERLSAFNQAISGLIEAGEPDLALQATAAIELPEERSRLLLAIADHLIQQGNPERAAAVLTQAFEVTQTIEGPESRTVGVREDLVVDDDSDRGSRLEAIALKYLEINQFNQALQVAQSLQDPSLREPLIHRITCLRNLAP